MNNDINLITQREQRRYAYSKVFLTTALLFGVIFTFALILILYSFFLKSQARSLSEDIALARAKMANYGQIKQKVLIVSERINAVKNIISKKSNLEIRTSQILASIPGNFSIDGINAEKDVVTLNLRSSSLLAFDDLFEIKLAALVQDQNLGVKKIESSSFSISNNYLLTLAFYFSEDTEK